MSLMGTRVIRTEDPKLLTHGGDYVGDLDLAGSAALVYVRSSMAHARILDIDTSAAATMPGVIKVLTAADIAHLPKLPSPFPGVVPDPYLRPMLATDLVRFVGEPVAAVIAENAYLATDASEQVVVSYEPLTVVVDLEESATDKLLFFEGTETNASMQIPAFMKANFDDCEVVLEQRIVNPRMAIGAIEPRCAAALWNGDHLTVYASSQGVHQQLGQYLLIYGLDESQVRVITPDVGGGFGGKGFPLPEELLVAEFSRQIGRPVTWTETRTENMLAWVHGRGQVQTIKIGGSRDGVISAYSLDILQDAGGYPHIGSALIGAGMMMLTGTYGWTNVGFSGRSVATNTAPTGAFRGAGRPEATAAIERAIDLFAAEIGMDPADVRRKNLLPAFDTAHTTPTGTKYDSGRYGDALELVLESAGYKALRAEQAERRARGDRKQIGIGLSCYVEITGMAGPDGAKEYGSVELKPNGTVLAVTGSSPHGQGHYTTWGMLISDELGIPMDKITFIHGDTDIVPWSNVTGGSRSAQIAGSAMVDASVRLATQATDKAADLLEAKADDVVLDKAKGVFHVKGTPAKAVSWADVAGASSNGNALVGISQFVQMAASFPFGAHCAVVEVDLDTGRVELLRHVAVDDCGTLLNPLLCDGQVHGGLASGAAQALIEEIRYDTDGNPQTSNFADYGIISAAELPSFERVEMVTKSPLNPLGAKGIGEAGTVGSTPAVQNAVIDAVSHLGVRHIDMPCTPERVWRAISGAEPH
ncbi:MAG: xanthine dehydrogenase family protein molybdopterin-binding subunit [Acidimicrobiales bacterium]